MNEIVRTREPETLPARAYWADEYWQLDKREIWAKTWVLVAGAGDFAKTGDYTATTVAGMPVLVVKAEDASAPSTMSAAIALRLWCSTHAVMSRS